MQFMINSQLVVTQFPQMFDIRGKLTASLNTASYFDDA